MDKEVAHNRLRKISIGQPLGYSIFTLLLTTTLVCQGKVKTEGVVENTPKVYYISPAGSFANPGTERSPWSLSKANSALLPGETAILMDGIYRHTPIAPVRSGKADAYIVYRAKSRYKAVFEDMDELPDSRGPVAIFVNGKSYISVQGIKVSGVKRWIMGVKSHHITIDNCYFNDASGWINSRFDEIGNGIRITNNYFNGGTDLLSLDGGEGHLVEGNFFGDDPIPDLFYWVYSVL